MMPACTAAAADLAGRFSPMANPAPVMSHVARRIVTDSLECYNNPRAILADIADLSTMTLGDMAHVWHLAARATIDVAPACTCGMSPAAASDALAAIGRDLAGQDVYVVESGAGWAGGYVTGGAS